MFGQPLARCVAAVVAGGAVCPSRSSRRAAPPPSTLATPSCCCSWSAARWSPSSPHSRSLRAAEGEITASNTFAFALLICYGPAPAAIAFALGTIRRRDPPQAAGAYRKPNAAQYVITVAAAGVVLSGVLAYLPHLEDPTGIEPSDLLGIVAAALVFSTR